MQYVAKSPFIIVHIHITYYPYSHYSYPKVCSTTDNAFQIYMFLNFYGQWSGKLRIQTVFATGFNRYALIQHKMWVFIMGMWGNKCQIVFFLSTKDNFAVCNFFLSEVSKSEKGIRDLLFCLRGFKTLI